MTAVHYRPWGLHQELWNEVNRFFNGVASNDEAAPAWTPAVDIEEHADKFVLYADVPGVDPASIDVTLDNGVLTLAGNRARRAEQKDVARRREERASGRFVRSFTLPDTADGDAITASGKFGVLEVVIPKRAAAQPRRITVN